MESPGGVAAGEAEAAPAERRGHQGARVPAQRLRRVREARGVGRGVEGRVAERERRLRAVRVRGEEDRRAPRPPVLRLQPPRLRRALRPGACERDRQGPRDWLAMALLFHGFQQKLA